MRLIPVYRDLTCRGCLAPLEGSLFMGGPEIQLTNLTSLCATSPPPPPPLCSNNTPVDYTCLPASLSAADNVQYAI